MGFSLGYLVFLAVLGAVVAAIGFAWPSDRRRSHRTKQSRDDLRLEAARRLSEMLESIRSGSRGASWSQRTNPIRYAYDERKFARAANERIVAELH